MRVAVIGSGNMGSALIRHLSKSHTVIISDRNETKGKTLAKETGSSFIQNPREAVKGAELVIFAIKPKDLFGLASSLEGALTSEQCIISILAGTKIASLRGFFLDIPIVRLMPNLAITVQKGILGFSMEEDSESRKKQLEEVFAGLGRLFWLPEAKMEAFSSLAASSPAFVLVLIEAMIESGICIGFSSSESKDIVLHVLEGTVAMLKEGTFGPEELKWQITSPGGTTIEGLKKLDEGSFRVDIWNAVEAAYQKAIQIGKG